MPFADGPIGVFPTSRFATEPWSREVRTFEDCVRSWFAGLAGRLGLGGGGGLALGVAFELAGVVCWWDGRWPGTTPTSLKRSAAMRSLTDICTGSASSAMTATLHRGRLQRVIYSEGKKEEGWKERSNDAGRVDSHWL